MSNLFQKQDINNIFILLLFSFFQKNYDFTFKNIANVLQLKQT
jgi:hypothetical protein